MQIYRSIRGLFDESRAGACLQKKGPGGAARDLWPGTLDVKAPFWPSYQMLTQQHRPTHRHMFSALFFVCARCFHILCSRPPHNPFSL